MGKRRRCGGCDQHRCGGRQGYQTFSHDHVHNLFKPSTCQLAFLFLCSIPSAHSRSSRRALCVYPIHCGTSNNSPAIRAVNLP
jgi:hypothetical protein